MVSGAKMDGAPQILSAGVRKTIQQIKEIVGNHSDADIYAALKETNMDPNETTQKLLNQDPFHEVKRKRDKKKESAGSRTSTSTEPRKNLEHVAPVTRPTFHPDRNVRKTATIHSTLPDAGVSREFRVVRDNRISNSSNRESKPVQSSDPIIEPEVHKAYYVKSRSPGTSRKEKPTFGRMEQTLNGTADSQARQIRVRDGNSNVAAKKEASKAIQQSVVNTAVIGPTAKPPSTASSSNSAIGVYSSSSDPVHVPSPDSRPAAAKIGAIKREVGANRQISDSSKLSSSHGNDSSNSHLSRDGTSSKEYKESLPSSGTIGKSEQSNQNKMPESTVPSLPVSRSFSNNQHNGRSHQLMGHQKAAQPNKEWKPKSSQKVNAANGPGVIGMPAKTTTPTDNIKVVATEVGQVKDQLSRVNISENQNVIIASHIRVSETDRSRLTFGSLGTAVETRNFVFQAAGSSNEPYAEASEGLPVSSAPEPSFEPANEQELDLIDEHVQNSGSGSPASVSASEQRLMEKKEVSTPEKLENYADLRLVRTSSPSYVSPVTQQQKNTTELRSFSSFDPQTGYDIPYFRPVAEESVRGQGLASPQEALISHSTNSIPSSSSMAILQQQQQQQQQALAQMYQQHQLQVSPYSNMMQYRQFISPLYVPPMPMPGYSSNAAAYPHPSNGNSYVLMAGSSSHMNSSGGGGGPKYAIQQFKPLQTGSPTVFGNFTSPAGYAGGGVLGNPAGIEDSSRLKYKDGNIYVPSPQAETSEIWMNTRGDIQSGSYYNVPGQTPHPAYLSAAHNNHSFNAAAAVGQSSQMPIPAFYHPQVPPQPAGMVANTHHFGPTIGGNVGMGVGAAAALAPGAQVGSYQQTQIGHQNWTGNF